MASNRVEIIKQFDACMKKNKIENVKYNPFSNTIQIRGMQYTLDIICIIMDAFTRASKKLAIIEKEEDKGVK